MHWIQLSGFAAANSSYESWRDGTVVPYMDGPILKLAIRWEESWLTTSSYESCTGLKERLLKIAGNHTLATILDGVSEPELSAFRITVDADTKKVVAFLFNDEEKTEGLAKEPRDMDEFKSLLNYGLF